MGKIILTGDRPTGKLHVGHYVGSLRERVRLQNTGDFDKIFTADRHSFYFVDAQARGLADQRLVILRPHCHGNLTHPGGEPQPQFLRALVGHTAPSGRRTEVPGLYLGAVVTAPLLQRGAGAQIAPASLSHSAAGQQELVTTSAGLVDYQLGLPGA